MTATRSSPPPTAEKETSRAASPARGGFRSLILDIGIPVGSYYLLRAAGCDVVTALALSSVFPAAQSVVALVRGRAVSGMAVLVLVVNVVSMAVSFSTGDPRMTLAKEGAVSSAIGIAILVSVLAGKPLMTAGMRPFLVRGDAVRDAAFGRLAVMSPRFRALERRFSIVWGIACLSECACQVGCAFTLPVATVVWLNTVLLLTSIGAGIVGGSFFSLPMEKMVVAEAAKLTEGQ
jgi:hypothetical protein